MKAAEIRALTPEQQEARLQQLHAEWRDLRFQEAVGKLTDTARIHTIRKEIARIHTIAGEQQREAVAQA